MGDVVLLFPDGEENAAFWAALGMDGAAVLRTIEEETSW